METIVTIIFVQSFMWAAVLLKKFQTEFKWLFLSFTFNFIGFFLLYLNIIGSTHIKPIVILSTGIFSMSLLTEYMLKLLHFGGKYRSIAPLLLMATSMIFLFLRNDPHVLLFGILPLLAVLVYEIGLTSRSIKVENYGSSLLEDKRFRLILTTLLIKGFFWITSFTIILILQNTSFDTKLLLNFYFILLAISIFILGYQANHTDIKSIKISPSKPLEMDSEWSEKIHRLMKEEKPWLDCELTLSDLAKKLDLSESELTIILNQKMLTSFYKLINSYRVEMVKSKLAEPSSKRFTILAAAYESGFNSKSTFYRIFKEFTGQTPKEYIDQLK
ncbi:MAG: helix-turn-helix transcriptional regulator [Crocinitomicaceae bacterium]